LSTGLLIVDATFLRHLANDSDVTALRRQLRMLDLALVPSVANVYEALKHPNRGIREAMLRAIDKWSPGVELLPWPIELLRQAAEALRRGHTSFRVSGSTPDTLTIDEAALGQDHEAAKGFLDAIQEAFEQPYRENREAFQRRLKRGGRPAHYASMKEFLDAHAVDDENLAQLAARLWDYSKVGGEPLPLEVLRTSEIWRIAFDAFAAALYGRAIAKEQQANPPGIVDLLQLVYMSGSYRARIFVTGDKSLHQIASTIFTGRYHNARVLLEGEFLT
jgi:hypothetical protein